MPIHHVSVTYRPGWVERVLLLAMAPAAILLMPVGMAAFGIVCLWQSGPVARLRYKFQSVRESRRFSHKRAGN